MSTYNDVKNYKLFFDKLEYALTELIKRYRVYFDTDKEERPEVLDKFSNDLERVSNLLDNYGYTYFPTNIEDISEGTFETLVDRYLDEFQKYIYGEGNLETLNVHVKNLLVLVDKHKNINEHFV